MFVILTSKRSYSAVETDLKLFKPVAGGVGTVEDASAFWFELSRREPFTAPTLAETLTPDDTVREFRPTEEGAGYDLALQVPLIPRTEKVLGAPESLEAAAFLCWSVRQFRAQTSSSRSSAEVASSVMEKLKAWWAKTRWAVWAVLGVIFGIMVLVFRSLLTSKTSGRTVDVPARLPVPKVLQEKVDKAEEDNLRARVAAEAKATVQKEQLEEVLKIDDGAERRKRLAAMLSKS